MHEDLGAFIDPYVCGLPIIRSKSDQELQKLYLKVNIPGDMAAYKRGNGEGMWAIPLSDGDRIILDADKHGTTAKVILCNDSLYYPPMCYGTVLQVEMREGFRPVLDIDWAHEVLAPIGIDFKAILEERDGVYE